MTDKIPFTASALKKGRNYGEFSEPIIGFTKEQAMEMKIFLLQSSNPPSILEFTDQLLEMIERIS